MKRSERQIKADTRTLSGVAGIGPKLAMAISSGHYPGIRSGLTKVAEMTMDEIELLPNEARMIIQYTEPKYPRAIIERVAKKLSSAFQPPAEGPSVAVICGSYRRGLNMCGDLDLLTNMKYVPRSTDIIFAQGDDKVRMLVKSRSMYIPVDILTWPIDKHGAALLYFTGSLAFNIKCRKVATSKGYRLSEHGLFNLETKEYEPNMTTEEAILECLNLTQYLDPKTRDL